MRKIIIIALMFLTFTAPAQAVKVKVIEVVGSNTVKVYHDFQTKYVKLAGVELAPSVAKKKTAMYSSRNNVDSEKVNKAGQNAKSELSKLIKPGDFIEVEFEKNNSPKKGDSAYFFDKDGNMINEKMIKDGFGVVSKEKSKYKKELEQSFESSKENQAGMWEDTENNKEPQLILH